MFSADGAGPDVPANRLRRIQALTDSGLARLEVDELLAEVTERVRELLEVDTVAVLLLDPSASYLVATATRGLEEEIRQGVRIPIGRGFAGRIAAERKAVIIPEVDHSNVMNPILREKGVQSLLGVPLMVGNDVIGVLHVGTLRSRMFTDDDAMLLQMAADRIALATRARMSQTERTAAAVLQRSLLPGQLPTIPASSSRHDTCQVGAARSGATGTTCSICPPGGCASWSATWWAAGCRCRWRWVGSAAPCARTRC